MFVSNMDERNTLGPLMKKSVLFGLFALVLAIVVIPTVVDGTDADADTCTVTFSFEGGCVVNIVDYGSIVEPPMFVPVKNSVDGIAYVFDGWYGYYDGLVAYDDLNFTAKFVPMVQHTVTVVCNDGSVVTIEVLDGDRIDGPSSIYAYFIDPEYTVEWALNRAVRSDVTLYAMVGAYGGSLTDSIVWAVDLDTRTLTVSGTGAMPDFAAASDAPWYSYRLAIENVVVCDGITAIGKMNFYNYSRLYDVDMGDTVTSIGKQAFYHDYSLEHVLVSKALRSVGSGAFSGISLKYSDGNTATPKALAGAELTGSCKVLYCHLLEGTLTETVGWTMDFDTRTFTVSGTGAMPDFKSTNEMAWYTFRGSMETIVIDDGITRVGEKSFYGYSAVRNVVLGNDVESLGTYAFKENFNIESLVVGDNLVKLGTVSFSNAFAYPNGDKITLSASALAGRTFKGIDGVLVLENVKGSDRNIDWALNCITGEFSVKGEGAMYDYSATSTPWYAFRDFIVDATIEDGLTSFSDFGFYKYTAVRSVVFSNTVQTLGKNCIRGCSNLEYVAFGSNLTTIGSNALSGMTFVAPDGASISATPANLAGCSFQKADGKFVLNSSVPYYDIVWTNYDGTVLQTSIVMEGRMPVYTGAVPVREATEQYVYTFVGWEPVMDIASCDIVYVAQFEATEIVYTVTFVPNGGNGIVTNRVIKIGDQIVRPISDPTLANCDFVGWSFSQYGGAVIDWSSAFVLTNEMLDTYGVDGVVTVYAAYTKIDYTFQFNVNGKTDVIPSITVKVGESVDEPAHAEPPFGMEFVGWSFIGNTSSVLIDWNTFVMSYSLASTYADERSVISVFAVFKNKEYEVDFDTNGGAGEIPSQMTVSRIIVEPEAPTMEGAFFAGWAFDTKGTDILKFNNGVAELRNDKVANYAVNGVVTLHAVWMSATCIVSFELNGGTGTVPDDFEVIIGVTEITKPENDPVRTGRVFDGWSFDSSKPSSAEGYIDWSQKVVITLDIYNEFNENGVVYINAYYSRAA
ncbi:MAG: leucine-rich repeat protein [archaeon]|nr:leucine-rich repeat protein [archaeon]